jgi:hypothetical protein
MEGGQQTSSSTQDQSKALTWQWNTAKGYAEWWDGQKWVQGEWNSERQKWMAYYGDKWYTWD